MKIMFLHGLESGPYGSKYQALKEMFGEITSPDCSGIKDESERLKIIQQEVRCNSEPFLVVGSSMGGLMALLFQQKHPDQVAGLVLCAPAVHRPAAKNLELHRLPPTVVIHGSRDEVVPLEASRSFGHRLLVVDDDHRLSNSMAKILRSVFEMKLKLLQFK